MTWRPEPCLVCYGQGVAYDFRIFCGALRGIPYECGCLPWWKSSAMLVAQKVGYMGA